jgi:hypothetical protein
VTVKVKDANGVAKSNPELTGLNAVEGVDEGILLRPFIIGVTIEGTTDILMHRYSVDAVAAKGRASKGSAEKKSDDTQSYVYRNDDGLICIPGRYPQRAIVEAARFHQDPRSPRKMAKDLIQAAVSVGPLLAPIRTVGNHNPSADWDYLDRQRVVVQRSAVTRERPAFRQGWTADFELSVLLPEYVSEAFLYRLLADAGKFVGLGDFRPTYGRFNIVNFQRLES